MAMLTSQMYESVVHPGMINFHHLKRIYQHNFNLLPRVLYTAANAAATAATYDDMMELVGNTDTNPVVARQDCGIRITTAAAAYDVATLQPLIALAAHKTLLADGVGSGATARTDGVLGAAFTTGAASLADSGRGIEFAIGIKTGAAITLQEIMVGLQGKTVAALGPVLEAATAGYTMPDDGFYFYYNSATGPNWYRCVNYGTTDEYVDTIIPVTLGTNYLLQAKLNHLREPEFYINGAFVGKGSAMDAETAITPVVSVKTLTTAAKYVDIHEIFLAANWG